MTIRTAFAAKGRIDHSVYGSGTVLEVNERYTTIDFDEAGKKKFLTSVVKLAPSDIPAPEKPRRKKPVKRAKQAS